MKTFQRHGEIEQPCNLFVAGADLPQLRLLFQRFREGRGVGRVERDQLRNPVDLAVGHAENPSDVADRGARLKRPESDDLGYPVGTVLFLDVADHLVPAVLAEIDVEVRHRHPIGVQETFEEEPETERVEVGDGERPGDHRSRARTASRAHRNPLLLGPLDEVGDDQEVARIAHLDDGPELEVQTLAVGFRRFLPLLVRRALGIDARLQARLQPRLRGGGQGPGLVFSLRGFEAGKNRLARFGHERAASGDGQRVVERLGQIGEQRAHLVGAPKSMVDREAPPILLGDMRAFGYAQKRIMRIVHGSIREIGLVGRDQRQIVAHREVDQVVLDTALDLLAVARELDIEPVRKRFPKLLQRAARLLHLPVGEKPAQRAGGAGGKRDQPRCVRSDIPERHMRVSRLGLEEGLRHQRHEVAVPLLVLHQQDEEIAFCPASCTGTYAAVRAGRGIRLHRRHRELAADDRLYPLRGGGHRELQRAEQVVGIGYRHGGHGPVDAELHEIRDLDRSFGQRVGRMDPEMDEICVGHGERTFWTRGQRIPCGAANRQSRDARPCGLFRPPERPGTMTVGQRRPATPGGGPSGRRDPYCGSLSGRRRHDPGRPQAALRRPTLRVCGSRLPVGSSAISTRGWLASARPMATLCCSPPDNRAGRWVARWARPVRSSISRARRGRFPASTSRRSSAGSTMFSRAENSGSRW